MFRVIAWQDSLKPEWDDFARQHGSVYHSSGFRNVLLRSFGYRCAYHAMVDCENRICALLPLIVSRNLGFKTAGVSLPFVNYLDICADSDEARTAALHFVQRFKTEASLDYVELRLKNQAEHFPDWKEYLEHFTFVLPLDPDEDRVLASAGSGCRNHVRKVFRNHWFTASYDTGFLEAFHAVYAIRMKQLGSPVPDISFFRNFFTEMPDSTRLLTVLDQQTGRVAGGMLLLKSPQNSTLFYPYGANLIEYNHRYLNSFMYWEAVRFAINQGFEKLDLGRSQAGSGTFVYKQQWGAQACQLSYRSYSGHSGQAGAPAKDDFSLAIALWKRLPREVTDPIGKRMIRYVLP